jgi:hypothetical protein
MVETIETERRVGESALSLLTLIYHVNYQLNSALP